MYAFGVDLILGDEGVCVATDGAPPDRRWVAETRNARSFSTADLASSNSSRSDLPRCALQHPGPPVALPLGNEITLGTQDFRQPVRAVAYTGPVGPGIRLRFTPMKVPNLDQK